LFESWVCMAVLSAHGWAARFAPDRKIFNRLTFTRNSA
jgi:hypothetical protein